LLAGGVMCLVALALPCAAQQASEAPASAAVAAETQEVAVVSDNVTINVVDGNIADVLNAFSRQTGKNIVIGPSVTNKVNLRLSETYWSEALDVILKPYGLGYKLVGKTIVIDKVQELATYESVEPLISKVFTLKYLDASDVLDMVQRQLSTNRGSVTILAVQGQKGWEFESRASGSRTGGGAGSASARERLQGAEKQTRSKTLIVRDTVTVIENISRVLNDLDKMPAQILIEARFVEVGSDFLRDIGLEFGTGANGAEAATVQSQGYRSGSGAYGVGLKQASSAVLPSAFLAASGKSLSGQTPFNAGMTFKFQQLTDTQFEVLLHMLQEDASMNVLSAPRILTLNNQEAAINVGQKFPIIKSDVSSGGTSGTVSTSLDYYESIGIQLNVVPQVCGNDYISMIVHPAVTDFVRTEGGVVATSSGTTQTTQYPVLSTREADTQIVLKNGSTIVIGGLLKNRDGGAEFKVPILGDIPILGNLFKRTTSKKEKLDLLIFLTASIVPSAEVLDVETAATAVDRIRESRAAVDRKHEQAVSTAFDNEQRAAAKRVVAADRDAEGDRGALLQKTREDAESARETERANAAAASAAREADQKRAEDARRAKQTKRAAVEKAKAAAEAQAEAEQKARIKAEKAENERLAAEAKKAREAEARKAEELREARARAEKEAQIKAAAAAEAVREAQERSARQAEKERRIAEKKARAEEARRLEEVRQAEKARQAAEERMQQEADRKAEEMRQAEEARIAAEKAAARDAARKAAAEKDAQIKAARAAEKARLAAERTAREEADAKAEAEASAAREAAKARTAEEKQAKAEAAAKAEADRKAEDVRIAAEKAAARDAAKKAEAERKAQLKAQKDAEKARLAAERKAHGGGFFSWLFGWGDAAKSQPASAQ